MTYTVKTLAAVAGISVRTLHHYDEIGLLRPRQRSGAGYRLYGEAELLRLQQILFYRELEFPLERIAELLDRPDFDPVSALVEHRAALLRKHNRIERLLATVDRTLAGLKGEGEMLKIEELYDGFTPEETERRRTDARRRYGEQEVEATESRMRKLSKAQWAAVQQEGGDLAAAMAALIGRRADEPEVQAVVARHHAWIENFYPAPAERYLGLAELYDESDEFRAFYERYGEGTTELLTAGMRHFAATRLAG